MSTQNNDGRRQMSKLKCPYGNHRFADVPEVSLRNNSELKRLSDIANADYILECPHCHQKVALCIKSLHITPTEQPRGIATRVAL